MVQKPLEEIIDTTLFTPAFLEEVRSGYYQEEPRPKNRFPIGWTLDIGWTLAENSHIASTEEWWGFTERDLFLAERLLANNFSEETTRSLLAWSKLYTDETYLLLDRIARISFEDEVASFIRVGGLCEIVEQLITPVCSFSSWSSFPDSHDFKRYAVYSHRNEASVDTIPSLTEKQRRKQKERLINWFANNLDDCSNDPIIDSHAPSILISKGVHQYPVIIKNPSDVQKIYAMNNLQLEVLLFMCSEVPEGVRELQGIRDLTVMIEKVQQISLLAKEQEPNAHLFYEIYHESFFKSPFYFNDFIPLSNELEDAGTLSEQQQLMVKRQFTWEMNRKIFQRRMKKRYVEKFFRIIKEEERLYIPEMFDELILVDIPNLTPIKRIGAGDFKVTYVAIHDVLEERVALKILNPGKGTLVKSSVRSGLYQLADRREYTGIDRKERALVRTFKEEAQALSKISHPHIARFLGAGLVPQKYVIEEYVEGRTLLEIALDPAERSKREYTERVSWSLHDIYEALLDMHKKFHIVHLDVKPPNIIISGDNKAVLTDFGCSHVLPHTYSRKPHLVELYKPISRIMKHPAIMADGLVGTYVDRWQWGITAYMVIFGHHPFCPELTIDDWYSNKLSSERKDEVVKEIEENSKRWLEQRKNDDFNKEQLVHYQTSSELIFGTMLPKECVRKATAFNPHFPVDRINEPWDVDYDIITINNLLRELA